MNDALLQAKGLSKRYGGLLAVNDVSLSLYKDQLHAVIGPNGAGKTTLISILAGLSKASAGRVTVLGRDVCGGELYAAHFLGTDAACKLIRLAGTDPQASAAAQFPQAAGANKSVFYRADGTAKSVREVYDWALRQPGDAGTVRIADLPDITPQKAAQARTTLASAHDAEIQMLLQSVMNWQPGGGHNSFGSGLFGNLFNLNGKPQTSALSFSPGLLGLLSDAKNDNS